MDLRSKKAINLPVLPPILPRALLTLLAAPLTAGPAAEVTRDNPSEALDLMSWAFEAASLVVVDSNRRAIARPEPEARCALRTVREMDNDIVDAAQKEGG